MYAFIKKRSTDTPLSQEELSRLERIWEIEIPEPLRTFWLEYNGAEIRPREFRVRRGWQVYTFCVTEILTVGYGQYDFAYFREAVKKNPEIPDTFVAFALDDGDNAYCWDLTDGRIYCADREEEAPIAVCHSMEMFFRALSEEREITLPAEKPQKRPTQHNATNKAAWAEEMLRFKEKPVMALVYLLAAVVSLAMIPFTDGLSVIITVVCGLWMVIFLGIWISHMRSYRSAMERYGRENLIWEMISPDTQILKDTHTCVTDNYIIYNRRRVTVIKLSDISWIYPTNSSWVDRGAKRFLIVAWLRNGKRVICGDAETYDQVGSVYDRVAWKNREVLVGYNRKNEKNYKKNCPDYRKRRMLEWILVAIPLAAALYISLRF